MYVVMRPFGLLYVEIRNNYILDTKRKEEGDQYAQSI